MNFEIGTVLSGDKEKIFSSYNKMQSQQIDWNLSSKKITPLREKTNNNCESCINFWSRNFFWKRNS